MTMFNCPGLGGASSDEEAPFSEINVFRFTSRWAGKNKGKKNQHPRSRSTLTPRLFVLDIGSTSLVGRGDAGLLALYPVKLQVEVPDPIPSSSSGTQPPNAAMHNNPSINRRI